MPERNFLLTVKRRWARTVRNLATTFSPAHFPYVRFALALIIGAAGGWLFAHYRMPLPWMLGALCATAIAALLRVPVAAPAVVRPPMTAVIGVLLGASLTAETLAGIVTWLPTAVGLMLCVAACGLACATYFMRVAGFDRTTAYFSGMPGGLVEMTTLGEQRGGDVRVIAICQSSRILVLVFTLPFLIRFLADVGLAPTTPAGGPSILEAGWDSHAWLLGTAAAGVLLGTALRLPALWMMGPLIVSAIIHMTGLSSFRLSNEIINGAQLVLGTCLGCSFARSRSREVLRIMLISFGSTVLLTAMTLAFAYGVSRLTGQGFVPLILAYSPGGLAEMSLMALVLNADAAFVVGHHIVRILFVIVCADPFYRLLNRIRPGGPTAPGGGQGTRT